MRKLLAVGALVGTLATLSGTAFAGGNGTDVSGALSYNPARLGFSPAVTAVIDAGVNVPGTVNAAPVWDKWYDDTTEMLNIRLDLSTQAKATQTVATFDALVGSLSGLQPEAAAGISIGRLGFGVVARGETEVKSNSSIDVTTDPITASLNASAKLLGRVDTVTSVGIPIGKTLAIGVTGKWTAVGGGSAMFQANSSDFTDGNANTDNLKPTGSYAYGQGTLVDLGFMLNLPTVQADIALKDIGRLTLEDPVPLVKDGAVAPSILRADMAHFAGGVTFRPSDQVSGSVYYDKTISGHDEVKLTAELRPIKLVTLRGGYVANPAFDNGLFTAGVGLNLWFAGLDLGATFKSSTFTGASARFRVGF